MAVVDKRNKALAYEGGSSQIAVGLTAVQAQEAMGDASEAGGWYIIGYQEGGQFGPDRDSEEVKDEADELVKVRTTRDEFVITNTVMQTDDKTLLLLEWLEDAENGVPARYPLPTNQGEGLDVEAQWVFLYNANVRKENWTVSTGADSIRSRQFTLVGTRDTEGNLKAIVTLPVDQGDPAWGDYSEFIDTAFP